MSGLPQLQPLCFHVNQKKFGGKKFERKKVRLFRRFKLFSARTFFLIPHRVRRGVSRVQYVITLLVYDNIKLINNNTKLIYDKTILLVYNNAILVDNTTILVYNNTISILNNTVIVYNSTILAKCRYPGNICILTSKGYKTVIGKHS